MVFIYLVICNLFFYFESGNVLEIQKITYLDLIFSSLHQTVYTIFLEKVTDRDWDCNSVDECLSAESWV